MAADPRLYRDPIQAIGSPEDAKATNPTAASSMIALLKGIFAAIRTTTTVASLPAAGTKGRRSFVTDANATTFASVVAGGGANNVPVYDDGTNWRIG